MANYRCRNGHTWLGRSKLSPDFSSRELFCPQPDCGLPAEPKLKQGGGFKADNESTARQEARQHFNAVVLAHGCFYSAYKSPTGKPRRQGHICEPPYDAHHIVEKNFIETNYADLPEEELLRILFDPRIGAPLCRGGHENVKSLHIYWDEVSEECKEACREVDAKWLDVLTPAGIQRKSMFGELRRVCPMRKAAA
jgi:hypothetical protein